MQGLILRARCDVALSVAPPFRRPFFRTQTKLSPLRRVSSCRTGRTGLNLRCSAAADTASNVLDFKEYDAELPEPPKTASMLSVFPYLLKVAFTKRTNYWRVFTALAFILLAKGSGKLTVSLNPTLRRSAGLSAPYFLKIAVEKLSMGSAFVVHCIVNIFLFGLCRVICGLTTDLQYAVFAPVAQVSISLSRSSDMASIAGSGTQNHSICIPACPRS